MKNAIILHGKPSKEEYYDPSLPSASNHHWIPWLQKQLIINGIKADSPEVPLAFEPKYDLWVKEIERFEITADTIIVGHSCGGGFWVRYLSENSKLHTGKIVLLSPSLGYGWNSNRDFFDFTIDPGLVSRAKGITIFTSNNDRPTSKESSEEIHQKLNNSKLRVFDNYGHFTFRDMRTTEFPELLEEILA